MSKLAAAGLSRTVAGSAVPAPPARAEASASRASASAVRTASSSDAAPSVRASPAALNRLARPGPLSPMRTAATARSATTGPRPDRSTPLSRPPAMSTIGAGKARRAAMTASGWVPCESLTNRTPSISGHGFETMLDAGECRGRPADGLGLDPEQQPDRDRGQGVRDVVRARDREFADRHDPAVGSHRRRAAAREREASHTIGDDPAIDDAEPARPRGVPAVGHDRRTPDDRRSRRPRRPPRSGRAHRPGRPARPAVASRPDSGPGCHDGPGGPR